MAYELRYHMFSSAEVCDAAIGFLNSRICSLLTHAQPKVDRITRGSVVISFRKNEFGGRDREVIPADEMGEALAGWCRAKGTPLPLGCAKTISQVGNILCLRVVSNIRDENVHLVERMIVNGSTCD